MVTVTKTGTESNESFSFKVSFKSGGVTYNVHYDINLSVSLSGYVTIDEPVRFNVHHDLLTDRIVDLADANVSQSKWEKIHRQLVAVVPSHFDVE